MPNNNNATGLHLTMHKDFFDRCRNAIDNGFCFEAVLMEYAAIEARLEVIMGVIGLPCNKNLPDADRRKIFVSDRIECLKSIRSNSELFMKSKLPDNFFSKLNKWIVKRNKYIHGLYKNELEYKNRIGSIRKDAMDGYELCDLLYREAKRLRRLRHNKALPEIEQPCGRKRCSFQEP